MVPIRAASSKGFTQQPLDDFRGQAERRVTTPDAIFSTEPEFGDAPVEKPVVPARMPILFSERVCGLSRALANTHDYADVSNGLRQPPTRIRSVDYQAANLTHWKCIFEATKGQLNIMGCSETGSNWDAQRVTIDTQTATAEVGNVVDPAYFQVPGAPRPGHGTWQSTITPRGFALRFRSTYDAVDAPLTDFIASVDTTKNETEWVNSLGPGKQVVWMQSTGSGDLLVLYEFENSVRVTLLDAATGHSKADKQLPGFEGKKALFIPTNANVSREPQIFHYDWSQATLLLGAYQRDKPETARLLSMNLNTLDIVDVGALTNYQTENIFHSTKNGEVISVSGNIAERRSFNEHGETQRRAFGKFQSSNPTGTLRSNPNGTHAVGWAGNSVLFYEVAPERLSTIAAVEFDAYPESALTKDNVLYVSRKTSDAEISNGARGNYNLTAYDIESGEELWSMTDNFGYAPRVHVAEGGTVMWVNAARAVILEE